MNFGGKTGRTLADIIQEKITEKHTELQTQFSDNGSKFDQLLHIVSSSTLSLFSHKFFPPLFVGVQMQELDPRVKEMYEGVRDVLSKYRSGKLPKAFKIVPKLRNWEQILYITGKMLELFKYKLKP